MWRRWPRPQEEATLTVDALILAGGRIPADFARAVGTDKKGLIEIEGRHAVEYVVQALKEAKGIGRIALVGPQEYADTLAGKLDAYAREGKSIGANLRAGMEALGLGDEAMLVVTCDAVCLAGRAIDEFLGMCPPGLDMVCPVITTASAFRAFPERKWVPIPLRGQSVVCTNMFVIRPRVILKNEALATVVGDARKNLLAGARVWGWGFVLKLFLRRLTMESIAEHVKKVAGVTGTGVVFPDPDIAMDLDDAADMPIVKGWFARRAAAGGATGDPVTT